MTIDPSQGTPDVAPPLDPELMQAIRASASRMMLLEGTFISQLHSDVMTLIPELAADGRAFCERMVRSVLWAAVTDQPPRVIVDTLRWVGATNWMEGFPEDEYASVAHALVRTVRDLSGDNWSTSIGSAWITYFLWIQPQLLIGAGQAIAQQQAAAQRLVEQPERSRAFPQDPYAMPVQAPPGDVSLNSVPGMPPPGMPPPGMPPPDMEE
jgi:hemoglobin-like flavoprotein